uniref:Uncharacterized protein n=1 Tax=Arundo donax TaxID=35708 RepID=A0A0A8ZH38_ARUDO
MHVYQPPTPHIIWYSSEEESKQRGEKRKHILASKTNFQSPTTMW